MGESSGVGPGPRGEQLEKAGMHPRFGGGRDRSGDRLPRQFVPEGHLSAPGDEHPRLDALVDGIGVHVGGSCDEVDVGSAGDEGCRIQYRARRAESPAARASTASRTVAGMPSGTADTSVTKNGLPPVRARTSSGIARGRESGHGGPAQRLEIDALGPIARREPADSRGERMTAADLVVAHGEDDHRRKRANPPREEDQEVAGRVIGPVHVLDDGDHRRRRGRERVDHGREPLVS